MRDDLDKAIVGDKGRNLGEQHGIAAVLIDSRGAIRASTPVRASRPLWCRK